MKVTLIVWRLWHSTEHLKKLSMMATPPNLWMLREKKETIGHLYINLLWENNSLSPLPDLYCSFEMLYR